MKTLIGISSLSLCLAAFPLFAEEANDCTAVRDDTWKQVSKDPTKVLEVVADMTAKMPPCSCSIVKAAIQSSKADAKLAASIVETAIKQAPEQMYVISQCAKAVAPEAAAEISEVDAIHPGDGPLATHERFAEVCTEIGIQLIGRNAEEGGFI